MAAISKAELEIVVKAQDQARDVLKKLGDETQNLKTKTLDLEGAFSGIVGALEAYAGTMGLKSLIDATENSNIATAQARFYLAGFGKQVDENLASLQKWATGMTKKLGVDDEYATLVASKLLPRVKDLHKAQRFGEILLRGQNIGMLDASSAANMLMRATEGNERALRFLLEQYGIAAPSFVSIETLFEELRRRIEEGEKAMSPYATEVKKLATEFDNFKERAGTPIVKFLGTALEKINNLIDRFPALGDIISNAITVIATALTTSGIMALLKPIVSLLAGMSGPAWIVIAAITALVAIFSNWKEILEFIKPLLEWINNTAMPFLRDIWKDVMATLQPSLDSLKQSFSHLWESLGELGKALQKLWEVLAPVLVPVLKFLGEVIITALIIGIKLLAEAISIIIKIIAFMIEKIAQSISKAAEWITSITELIGGWDKFKKFWLDLWAGVKQAVADAVDWVSQKVDSIVAAASRAMSAINPLNAARSTFQTAADFISGKRAGGGPVYSGSSYLVGERGPELFTPSTSGYIVSNAALAGGGGGIMIDMRGSTFLDRNAAVEIGDQIMARLKEIYRIGY